MSTSARQHLVARALLLALLLLPLLLVGCAEDLFFPERSIATGSLRVELWPVRASGIPGDRIYFHARVVSPSGETLEGRDLEWSHTAPTVARLTETADGATALINGIGVDTVLVSSGSLEARAVVIGRLPRGL